MCIDLPSPYFTFSFYLNKTTVTSTTLSFLPSGFSKERMNDKGVKVKLTVRSSLIPGISTVDGDGL